MVAAKKGFRVSSARSYFFKSSFLSSSLSLSLSFLYRPPRRRADSLRPLPPLLLSILSSSTPSMVNAKLSAITAVAICASSVFAHGDHSNNRRHAEYLARREKGIQGNYPRVVPTVTAASEVPPLSMITSGMPTATPSPAFTTFAAGATPPVKGAPVLPAGMFRILLPNIWDSRIWDSKLIACFTSAYPTSHHRQHRLSRPRRYPSYQRYGNCCLDCSCPGCRYPQQPYHEGWVVCVRP